MKFAYDLEANLFRLERQLQNRTYRPGQSIAFIVQKPKIREIFAADFRDRVIHHLLYNYLSPYFERLFIYDSWACREGKGTHGAMLRLQKFEVQLAKECGQDKGNVHHAVLASQPASPEHLKCSGRRAMRRNKGERMSWLLPQNGHQEFFYEH